MCGCVGGGGGGGVTSKHHEPSRILPDFIDSSAPISKPKMDAMGVDVMSSPAGDVRFFTLEGDDLFLN